MLKLNPPLKNPAYTPMFGMHVQIILHEHGKVITLWRRLGGVLRKR